MKEELFIWFMTTTRWRTGVPQFFYNAELSDLENPTNSDWKYMKGKHGGWHYMLKDAELERVMKQQQAEGFPTLMFYDKSHQLVKTKVGQMSEEDLRSIVQQIVR